MAKRAEGGWHRDRVKAELKRLHGSITHLSQSWGYNRTAITCALRRTDYSVTLERRIADALAVPPHVIWPDRWAPNGAPNPRPVVERHLRRSSETPKSQKPERAVA